MRPLRVLLVVGAMDRGGIENWLMGIARAVDPRAVELVFVAHRDEPSHHDPEITGLGHRVVVCRSPRRPLGYARRFARLIDELGPVDAVHSFVSSYSAVPLAVARVRRVPVRVAHSQTDRRRVVGAGGTARRIYTRAMTWAVRRTMTHGLACTSGAAAFLFDRAPRDDPRVQVLPNGIDLAPFAAARGRLRADLGLAEGTLLVGHVGRFVPVKNQAFLVEVAERWRDGGADVHLVLVGDGPERAAVEHRVRAAGLEDRVTLTGARDDIPAVMADLDVLVLPSRWEGSPITVVEAQASGVPCLVSSAVSPESEVVEGLLARVAHDDDAGEWATAVGRLARADGPTRESAQRVMADSPWSLPVVVDRLCRVWSGEAAPESVGG